MSSSHTDQLEYPPESWLPARRVADAFKGPIERFLHLEAAGGVVLIIASATALIWANSPWADSYFHLWHTKVALHIGDKAIEHSLHFWINDLLMALFFLVAGIEIKREMVQGALSDLRRAALPVAAALGGMFVPAAIYSVLNLGGPAQSGWAVPMATDIAFAVGVVILLGNRVPAALRVLLLAVAIVDDLGAIVVITCFYSSGMDPHGLIVVGVGFAVLFLMRKLGTRPGLIFLFPLLILWVGLHEAGIHPTVAGVIVGLTVPVKPWFGRRRFAELASKSMDEFYRISKKPDVDDHELVRPLNTLVTAGREAVSPALRSQMELHPWVSFLIMPLFALANAGVPLGGLDFGGQDVGWAMAGVIVGLAVGKPLGVMLFSWICVKLRWCVLPPGVTWRGMAVLGLAAGIGFTMAIFIGELAFKEDRAMLSIIKLAVLVATACASVGALLLGVLLLPKQVPASIKDVPASTVENTAIFWVGQLEELQRKREEEEKAEAEESRE